MEQKEIRVLLMYISMGLKVLSARLALLLSLALTFSLFAWAMWNPKYETIGCASLFAILVFLPMIKLDYKQSSDRKVINPEGDQNE